jgi:hypothetical protein
MSECLIKKFERLKTEYLKAFKSKLLDVCRKIGDELFEIVKELRAQGMSYSDLGLSNDGEFIVRSFEMVAKNPTSEYADRILADAKWLKCENCSGKCESTPIMRTMIGFEEYVLNPDGSLSFPPKEEPEPQPNFPQQLITRNVEYITETYPEICSLECPHYQCSSYGSAQVGKPCRNRTPTNEELKNNPALW